MTDIVENIAKNYVDSYPYITIVDKTERYEGFIDGYNTAKEYISIDNYLPIVRDKSYEVLVKHIDNSKSLFTILGKEWSINIQEMFYKAKVTHWKYID